MPRRADSVCFGAFFFKRFAAVEDKQFYFLSGGGKALKNSHDFMPLAFNNPIN